jgi:hypothetical protein
MERDKQCRWPSTSSTDHLQRLLYKFKLNATKYNTNISVEETKLLTLPKEPARIKLEVQGKLIE